MNETEYSVLLDFRTRGSVSSQLASAVDHARALQTGVAGIREMVGGLAGAFANAVESVATLAAGVGAAGLTAAIGAATYGVVGLNAELEKTSMSLAAIFNANGAVGSIGDGMALAKDMMAVMRKDAAALPGEFSDLVGIFRMVQIPGLRAGASVGQLEKLSANIMAAGASAGLDMHMVAREAGQLVSGHAGSHNILGSMLFGLQGDQAKEFNKKSDADRLAWLEQNMGKYSAAIGLFGGSFDALSSSLIDSAKKFATEATGPLFDRIKSTMAEANNWFDANQETVRGWSTRIGSALVRAFEQGKHIVLEYGPALLQFAEAAETRVLTVWQRVEPLVSSVAEQLKESLSNGAALDRIEQIVKLYATVKGLQLGASVGRGAADIFGSLSGVFGGAEAAGGAAIGIASMTAAAVAAAAALGEFSALSNLSSPKHEEAVQAASSLGKETVRLADNVIGAGSALESFGVAATSWASKILGFLNEDIEMKRGSSGWGDYIETRLNSFVFDEEGAQKNKLRQMEERERIERSLGIYKPTLAEDETFKPSRDYNPYADSALPKVAAAAAAAVAPKKGAGHGGGGTTVQKVEIVVSSNQDPSRIARMVLTEVKNLHRHPKIAESARNWSE